MPIKDKESSWRFFHDACREPAENMAVDEVLLHGELGSPILRIYGWSRPAVTIGYFQPHSAAGPGDHVVIRRISGGGVVDHRNDLTFALVFGGSHMLYQVDRFESYRQINQVVANALNSFHPGFALSPCDLDKDIDREKMVCFKAPVRYDVVDVLGKKVCGGAQRRRRTGMLHQGSIALGVCCIRRGEVVEALIEEFSNFFGAEPTPFDEPADFDESVRDAVSRRYSLPSWNQRK